MPFKIDWQGALENIGNLVTHGSLINFEQRKLQAEEDKRKQEDAQAAQEKQAQLAEKAIKDNELYNSKLQQNQLSVAAKTLDINKKIQELNAAQTQRENGNKKLISPENADTTSSGVQQLMNEGISAFWPKPLGKTISPDQTSEGASTQSGVIAGTPPGLEQYYLDASKKFGIPANWLTAQAAQESMNFNPDVISGDYKSPAGATGLQQFMPNTIDYVKKNYNKNFNPNDPKQAVDAAAWFMSDLINRTTGGDVMHLTDQDIMEALKAYNAGPGNYRAYGSSMDFPETKKYVSNIKKRATGK